MVWEPELFGAYASLPIPLYAMAASLVPPISLHTNRAPGSAIEHARGKTICRITVARFEGSVVDARYQRVVIFCITNLWQIECSRLLVKVSPEYRQNVAVLRHRLNGGQLAKAGVGDPDYER